MLHVGEQLGFMHWSEFLNCLDLDDDVLGNDQIEPVDRSNLLSLVRDWHVYLPPYSESVLSQLQA